MIPCCDECHSLMAVGSLLSSPVVHPAVETNLGGDLEASVEILR
jgi:hypothetical protein